jgi:RNA 2',3'-cyclic 3'-phosphodiesterase
VTRQPPETIRAFVGLDLDPPSLRRVARVSDRLRMASGAPSATWVPAAGMHVTLKFMGELPIDTVAPLGAALGPLAKGKSAPKACPIRLNAFPAIEQARIVMADLEDASGDLAQLAEQVERLAHKHGIQREDRHFRPHVTLARLKRPFDARRWLRPELAALSGECKAASLTLFRSELGAVGPTYAPVVRFAFA